MGGYLWDLAGDVRVHVRPRAVWGAFAPDSADCIEGIYAVAEEATVEEWVIARQPYTRRRLLAALRLDGGGSEKCWLLEESVYDSTLSSVVWARLGVFALNEIGDVMEVWQ